MEQLIMAPGHRDSFRSKWKSNTIRNGHRPQFKVGEPVGVVSKDHTWGCTVILAKVLLCTYRTIPISEIHLNGFSDRDAMFIGMSEYYRGITLDSEVTVIAWREVFDYWEKPKKY